MKVVSSTRRHLLSLDSIPSHLTATSPQSDTPSEPTSTRKTKYISHDSVITLIKQEKNPELALQLFNKASTQKGFHHNHSTYAIILNKLAQYKKYHSLDDVLHRMTYETCKFQEGIFLNLMKEFSKSSMHERVIEMFNSILRIVRTKPSMKAVSTCLNLLVDASRIDLARSFILSIRKDFHMEPNTCIFNILVKYHCKKGDMECAFEVLREMEKFEMSCPNLITYSTLIDGLCAKGRLEEAINLFEKMVSKHQIVPDALTYNVLINGFCRGGKTDRAWKIIEFMKKNGCRPNVFNYSSLMNGLCRDGKLEEAKDVVEEMQQLGLKPDTITYTTLINYFCRALRTDEAIEMLREMKDNEIRADVVTFNVILGGLCREYRYSEALKMLEKLPNDGVYLNKASYRIVLNFLCKEGELEKAVGLLNLMLCRGFVPHFRTSNELLISLCKVGKVNDAAMVMFGLVDMGFKPEPVTWGTLIDLTFRERNLLPAFQLLDKLLVK
ncbi:hypothetical protein CASFOL_009238 [Castilleja foliolosa]|uniref:Pentatricopeptide repeat-containing protein n=1 Tax=Castilleja foliolosa TaxID=1961234 RepID=A0ABD3DXQ4_9LAMI